MEMQWLVARYERGEAKVEDMVSLLKVGEQSKMPAKPDPYAEFFPFVRWWKDNREIYKDKWPEQHADFEEYRKICEMGRLRYDGHDDEPLRVSVLL